MTGRRFIALKGHYSVLICFRLGDQCRYRWISVFQALGWAQRMEQIYGQNIIIYQAG